MALFKNNESQISSELEMNRENLKNTLIEAGSNILDKDVLKASQMMDKQIVNWYKSQQNQVVQKRKNDCEGKTKQPED